MVLLAGIVALVNMSCLRAGGIPHWRAADPPGVAELRGRAEQAESLSWLSAVIGRHPWLHAGTTRSHLIDRRHRPVAGGDADAARASGVLAAEAQVRALRVLGRWVNRIDPETGLLPKGVAEGDHLWDYADAGADLFPHLVIAAALLDPAVYSSLSDVLPAERAIAEPYGLPANVDLTTNRPDERRRDRMYGAVEYAKDGLLPLSERLGRGPWLDRLQELAQAVVEASPTQTRFGRIPSEESEVNGQALQFLSRLYWATGDDTHRLTAERIGRAYLELVLPTTGWIPPRTWAFGQERPNTKVAQLRDHGNEVVAGLVEFHLIETARGEPDPTLHRSQVRAMLDGLLERGRTPDGLWKSTIDLDTGASLKDTLSDGWGYLSAAYLSQAMIEETWPNGDSERARRYRAAAESALQAAAKLELYPWQGTEPDGYADTIEGALYVLNRVPSTEAARWVDRQAGTLFGAQDADGRVEDRYLDGNFVRTALLYAAWQTHGVRLAPWEPGTMLGSTRDAGCLIVVVASTRDWHGRMIFDAPRHRLHIGLPLNYPRLNEWPEWFVAEPERRYRVDDSSQGLQDIYDGTVMMDGLELQLAAGAERQFRVCPSAE